MGAIIAEVVDTGEKRDGRGRRITPRARRAELVRAYRASGLTQAAFARQEGVKYPTFAHWVQQSERAGGRRPPVQFTELRLPAAPRPSAAVELEVRLPDGTLVRGTKAAELAALVRALRG
jgi:transposase-like protein